MVNRLRLVRTGLLVLLVLTTTLLAAGGVASAQEPRPGLRCDTAQPDDDRDVATSVSPGEQITAYAIDVELRPDGSAHFVERIDYDFGFNQRHGIYRDIIIRQPCNDDYNRVYPFEFGGVSSGSAPDAVHLSQVGFEGTNPLDGISYWRSGQPMQRIRIGDENRTINGQHDYEISYDLDAVTNRVGDGDQFYWNVIGNGWAVDIHNITVNVHTPEGATAAECFAGPTGSTEACTTTQIVDGVAVMTQERVGPHENVTVKVAYPRSATEPQALFSERWSLGTAFQATPFTVGGAGLLLLLFVGGFIVLAWRTGRDEQAVGSHVDVAFASGGPAEAVERTPLLGGHDAPVEFVPPEGVRPGQAGLLIDEKVDKVDVTATIVDLAVRGYLSIEEIDRKLRKDDYELTRTDKDTDDLLKYEEMLLRYLIATPGSSVKMSDLRNRFAADYGKVERALYEDARLRKWFHGRPDKIRAKWRGYSFLLLVAGLVALVAGALFTHLALLAIPVILASIVLGFGSRFMPRRTALGTGLTHRLRGFEEFIRDSEAVRARWAEDRNIFSEYLPYAIVFRCADKWAKVFEDLGIDQQDLGWYRGHDFRPTYISRSMTTFTASAATTLTSTASSGSGGGGGGGFSGGGGGGGGGGSW